MSLGEHATLTCTGDYAYGAKGFPAWGIGPNATLVFEARSTALISVHSSDRGTD